MKCVNCTTPAKYLFRAPGIDDQPYCDAHLPLPYRNTEYVIPAPGQVEQPVSAIADPEPLVEVVDVADEDKKPARRSRKTSAER